MMAFDFVIFIECKIQGILLIEYNTFHIQLYFLGFFDTLKSKVLYTFKNKFKDGNTWVFVYPQISSVHPGTKSIVSPPLVQNNDNRIGAAFLCRTQRIGATFICRTKMNPSTLGKEKVSWARSGA
jgi:hypothetical protein